LENILLGHSFTGKYSPMLPQTTLPMENIPPIHLQEIIFSSSDKLASKQLSKLEKAGKIGRLPPVPTHPILPTARKRWFSVTCSPYSAGCSPATYLRMLQRAHELSATIVGEDMDAMKIQLEKSNAFKAHDEAALKMEGR
jgi:hypothetical protein